MCHCVGVADKTDSCHSNLSSRSSSSRQQQHQQQKKYNHINKRQQQQSAAAALSQPQPVAAAPPPQPPAAAAAAGGIQVIRREHLQSTISIIRARRDDNISLWPMLWQTWHEISTLNRKPGKHLSDVSLSGWYAQSIRSPYVYVISCSLC